MRSVGVHALLALLGLVLAYQTWTREEEPEETLGEVTIAQCARDGLVSLMIETPRYANTVVPRRSDGQRTFWISHQRKPKPPKEPAAKVVGDAGVPSAVDAGVEGAEPSDPPPLPKPELFVTNAKFEGYLKSVLPLRAHRSIGQIEADREAEFGFDEVDTFFAIDCGGTKLEFEVGGRTYGTAKRYVRRKDSKDVFLLEGAVVQDLQSARYKFRQTDLHAFPLDDAQSADVRTAGMQRKLVRRNLGRETGTRWVDADAPDKRNELFGNWFSRVEKLRVNTYLGDDESPGADLDGSAGEVEPPQSVLEVTYATKGGKAGRLEVSIVKQGDTSHHYGRTETTVNWVKLYSSAAKGVVEDARLVVGAEPLESEDDGASDSPPAAGSAPAGRGPAGPHGGFGHRGGHGPAGPHGGHGHPRGGHGPLAPGGGHP